MISVLILYPKTDGSRFDLDYYAQTHMPLFAEALGEACHGWGVIAPGDGYHAVGWAKVSSHDEFGAAMAARGGPVIADVVNYTDVEPQFIIGDVVV
jgi:uncharacterized protein (TIGR02118 family)